MTKIPLLNGPGSAYRRVKRTRVRLVTVTPKEQLMAFGASTTAAEVLDGVDLSGRRAVVTGGGSGIGLETARVLAAAGAEVTIGVRDVDAGRRAAGTFASVEALDLSDQASVARFAAGWT